MAIATPRVQSDSVRQQLLVDLQSYIYEAGDAVRFADLVHAFPGIPAAALLNSLAELEAHEVISLTIQHQMRRGST